MAEDRTPRIGSQSDLVPCPPDDVAPEKVPGDRPQEHWRRKPHVPAAENRRDRSEPEIPFRTRSV